MPGITLLDDGADQDATFLQTLFASAPFQGVAGANGKVLGVDAQGNIVLVLGGAGGGGTGNLPMGAMIALRKRNFPDTSGPVVTVDGMTFLRTGWTAVPAEFPNGIVDPAHNWVGEPNPSFADLPYCEWPNYIRVG